MPAPGPHLIVVSMDTFRADRLGTLTPSLNALSAESLLATQTFSASNETLFSHAALFTGELPTHYGELDYRTYALPPDTPTLAARLSRAGYRTEAVVAGGHLAPDFSLTAGFQRYQSMQDFSSFQETLPIALDRLDALARGDRPFFLFIHGYDTHTPYVRPGPLFRASTPAYEGPFLELARDPLTYERIYAGLYYPSFYPGEQFGEDGRRFLDPEVFSALESHASENPGVPLTDADLAFLRGHYDSAVRTADLAVGILLETLGSLGLDDDTILVVLSDHGEDLMEHGFFNHRQSLHDTNTHVPLMIRGPGVEPGVISTPTSLLDVLPTVLGLLDQPPPETPGQDLRGPTDADRIVRAVSLRGHQSWRSSDGLLILSENGIESLSNGSGTPLSPADDEARRLIGASEAP